jgi:hypothetical protein
MTGELQEFLDISQDREGTLQNLRPPDTLV